MAKTNGINPLQALLGATLDVKKEVPIKRLDTAFTVKAISGDVFDRISMRLTYSDGKGGKHVDNAKLDAAIVAEACVEPSFADRSLIEHYGAEDATDCVRKALMAGEIKRLVNAVLEISGFGDDADVDFPN